MDEKITAIAGAEPVDKGQKPDSPSGADAKPDSSTEEKLPFDQHPKWKSARVAEKKLDELLKANSLSDPDDLVELIQSGKAVRGKIADIERFDEYIEKAKKFDQYEAYWKDQDERKRRDTEDPDKTIARLDAELRKKEMSERQKEQQRAQAEQAKKAVQNYESEVKGFIKDLELPKEQRGFVLEFFGVENPANDIDITDKKAIKLLVAEGLKKKEAYDQAVIAAYLKTKDSIPKITSGGGAVAEPTKTKHTLKDMRRAFEERLRPQGG